MYKQRKRWLMIVILENEEVLIVLSLGKPPLKG